MPMTVWVGRPGMGKTLRLVRQMLEDKKAGRTLYANFRMGHREDGYLVPVCESEHCRVFGYHHRERLRFTGEPEMWMVPSHGESGYEFRPRSRVREADARREGWRSGRGFVPDDSVTVLSEWGQVTALRVMWDAFDVAHKMRLVEGEAYEDEATGEIRHRWSAEPECRVWDCGGCSKGISIGLDELPLWANAREWQKMSGGAQQRMSYIRKDGIALYATAQHESRMDVIARQIMDTIWVCRKVGPTLTLPGGGQPWPLSMFPAFQYVRHEPELLTEKARTGATDGAQTGVLGGMFASEWHWGVDKEAADAYATYEHVQRPSDGVAASGSASARTRAARPVRVA